MIPFKNSRFPIFALLLLLTTIACAITSGGSVEDDAAEAPEAVVVAPQPPEVDDPSPSAPTPGQPVEDEIPEAEPPEAEPGLEETIYKVRPGDTLYRISLACNINLEELAQYNGIEDVNVIEVGQEIRFPGNCDVNLIAQPDPGSNGGSEIAPTDESNPIDPGPTAETSQGQTQEIIEVGKLRPIKANVLFGRREENPLPILQISLDWQSMNSGHAVSVDASGEAEVQFVKCSEPLFLRLMENSRLVPSTCSGEDLGNALCLLQGSMVYNGTCTDAYEFIETPSARMIVHGTSFQLSYLPESMITRVIVDDGNVEVQPVDPASPPITVNAAEFVFTTPIADYQILNDVPAETVALQSERLSALNLELANVVFDDAALRETSLRDWDTRMSEVTITELVIPTISTQGRFTLSAVRERGLLNCGVAAFGTPGFSFITEEGEVGGFDIDFCRALALAVLANVDALEFRPLTASERFPVLQSGEIDVEMSARTIRGDQIFGSNLTYVTYHDGQGIMVHRDGGIISFDDFADGRICVQEGSSNVENLQNYIDGRDLNVEIILNPDLFSAFEVYEAGDCEGISASKISLGMIRMQATDNPGAHIILNESLSIDPKGPLTRANDENWNEILRRTVLCTINAESLGVNQENVDSFLGSADVNISNLLGVTGDLGSVLGLSNDFCYQIIKQIGNYAEIYNRHLGPETLLNIPRSQNELFENGGLFYPQLSFRVEN